MIYCTLDFHDRQQKLKSDIRRALLGLFIDIYIFNKFFVDVTEKRLIDENDGFVQDK